MQESFFKLIPFNPEFWLEEADDDDSESHAGAGAGGRSHGEESSLTVSVTVARQDLIHWIYRKIDAIRTMATWPPPMTEIVDKAFTS